MAKQITLDRIISSLRITVEDFPDKRTGKNLTYSMEDIALGGFSVFFTQSPSFLYHQESMKKAKGMSNAETIFQIKKIPTDNHIRDILDEVPPDEIFPVYDFILARFRKTKYFDLFRTFNRNILVALDGVWYFSSQNIHSRQLLCH